MHLGEISILIRLACTLAKTHHSFFGTLNLALTKLWKLGKKDKNLHKPKNSFPMPLEMHILPFSLKTVIFDKDILLC